MLHALVARALLVPLRREVVLLLLERTLALPQVLVILALATTESGPATLGSQSPVRLSVERPLHKIRFAIRSLEPG